MDCYDHWSNSESRLGQNKVLLKELVILFQELVIFCLPYKCVVMLMVGDGSEVIHNINGENKPEE